VRSQTSSAVPAKALKNCVVHLCAARDPPSLRLRLASASLSSRRQTPLPAVHAAGPWRRGTSFALAATQRFGRRQRPVAPTSQRPACGLTLRSAATPHGKPLGRRGALAYPAPRRPSASPRGSRLAQTLGVTCTPVAASSTCFPGHSLPTHRQGHRSDQWTTVSIHPRITRLRPTD
jgi:hypothetical protein